MVGLTDRRVAGRARAVIVLITLIVLLGLQGCEANKSTDTTNVSNKRVKLILAAYTTPREAYAKLIIPGFQKYWKSKTGQEVEFQESYQGSGAQSRAIVAGFEADIAALSHEEDINRISAAELITHDWKSKQQQGMVSTSIVVIAVRQGNPKGIKDWTDLAKPGLNILTPDPKTSGGAQWNINAIYGAALRGFAGVAKDDPEAAQQFLKTIFKNVSIMDKGARESITNFEKGIGDIAITYENEVLVARQGGQNYEYIVPKSTILIENPVALVDKHVDKHNVREVAEAFIEYLFSKEAQQAYSAYGLRSFDEEVFKTVQSQFPPVQDLWKIDYLGGWKRVSQAIYGPQGLFTKVIEESHIQ
ncbi:MAG: sulfate ABC transporter substrate-binding protein [Acidobacteriota bacterium]